MNKSNYFYYSSLVCGIVSLIGLTAAILSTDFPSFQQQASGVMMFAFGFIASLISFKSK